MSQDPDNTFALLLLADEKSSRIKYDEEEYDEKLINKLISLKVPDAEINSMLLFAASRFYIQRNVQKREELLLQSIKEYPYHVMNNIELAEIYDASNKLIEAQEFKKRGFYNITRVLSGDELYEEIESAENFIACGIKGIWVSEDYYNELARKIDKHNKE